MRSIGGWVGGGFSENESRLSRRFLVISMNILAVLAMPTKPLWGLTGKQRG
jgi:hypothetical protein